MNLFRSDSLVEFFAMIDHEERRMAIVEAWQRRLYAAAMQKPADLFFDMDLLLDDQGAIWKTAQRREEVLIRVERSDGNFSEYVETDDQISVRHCRVDNERARITAGGGRLFPKSSRECPEEDWMWVPPPFAHVLPTRLSAADQVALTRYTVQWFQELRRKRVDLERWIDNERMRRSVLVHFQPLQRLCGDVTLTFEYGWLLGASHELEHSLRKALN